MTLRPSGSRHETRTALPGCGGFFIGMVVLPSVVVDQLHIVDGPVLEAEDDAPIGPHRDRPIAPPVPLEGMQPVPGKAHGFGGAGDVELGEHHFHPIMQIGAEEASVSALVEALESSMSEAPYHLQTVKRRWTLVNDKTFRSATLMACLSMRLVSARCSPDGSRRMSMVLRPIHRR